MPRIARFARPTARQILSIPISAIDRNPAQPRAAFDEESVRALAASIGSLGLLQPVSVRPAQGGRYTLIAGERRLRACQLLGQSTIEATVTEADEGESALLALVENLQREDLHFLDEAAGYARVMRLCALSQEALARRLGKTQGAIANKLRLLRLEETVLDDVRGFCLSERQARALLRLPDGDRQRRAAAQMARQKLTALRSEALVEEMLRADTPAPRRRVLVVVRDYRPYVNAIRDIARRMQEDGLAVEMETEQPGAELVVHLRAHRKKCANT